MHFIGRDIAGLRQNIHFQPQKVGGQKIGFAQKDLKVGGQLPALPNRLRRLCTRENVEVRKIHMSRRRQQTFRRFEQ